MLIVAYDGSASAREAVRQAAALMTPCRMFVVTVWNPALAYETPAVLGECTDVMPAMNPEVAQAIETGMHRRAEDVAREGAELASSLGASAVPLAVPGEGSVAHTLLKLAEDKAAAAIVVGSRGLSGIWARLEGSTSQAIAKHSRCPVLLVHEPAVTHPIGVMTGRPPDRNIAV